MTAKLNCRFDTINEYDVYMTLNSGYIFHIPANLKNKLEIRKYIFNIWCMLIDRLSLDFFAYKYFFFEIFEQILHFRYCMAIKDVVCKSKQMNLNIINIIDKYI